MNDGELLHGQARHAQVAGPLPRMRRDGTIGGSDHRQGHAASRGAHAPLGAEHRFCPAPDCPVVYFGHDEVFDRDEIVVPVFQKEPTGERTVCYCFAISEREIRTELIRTGRSSASERISALVKADRCACEVRNPQGTCCLGNVAAAVEALQSQGPAEKAAETPRNA